MRPLALTAAGALAVALLLPLARPAQAQWGAIAYNGKTGHFGMSWNQLTPKAAIGVATRDCGTSGCRVVVRFGAKACAAVALSGKPGGIGASARPSLDQARAAALKDCEKAKAGECAVKVSHCNK
ncbi:MAG: DUF4189 domain-containing protein [Stellaceae bacterium]